LEAVEQHPLEQLEHKAETETITRASIIFFIVYPCMVMYIKYTP
jgi:hypothetical protein